MANNYNGVARFYDGLSRMVFGRAIVNAQVYLIQYIQPSSKILIAGGGTGWILDELTRLHPSGLEITYVEVSAKMLELSAKRNTGANKVEFINAAVEKVATEQIFDVVITPFLFDNFNDSTAGKVFEHLNAALKRDGMWLYADFELNGRWWQKPLLKIMYAFFKMWCGIEASQLPNMGSLFAGRGYRAIQSKQFFRGFITSTVYKITRNALAKQTKAEAW